MSSNWYEDPFDDPFSGTSSYQSSCLHRHVIVVTTGRRKFVDGEVMDDIQEHLQCLDCLEYVSEAEVRGARDGDRSKYIESPIGD